MLDEASLNQKERRNSHIKEMKFLYGYIILIRFYKNVLILCKITILCKEALVLFPVRAHAWVVGQVHSRGRTRGNHTLMFLSLLLCLKINK